MSRTNLICSHPRKFCLLKALTLETKPIFSVDSEKFIFTVKNSTEKTKPGWVKHRASCETQVYPPPRHVRNVRKRRNSFVEGDNSFFTRSMFSTSTHDEEETTSRRSTATTIYRVFQQVHEFEQWKKEKTFELFSRWRIVKISFFACDCFKF